jgi:sugar phosphate isomerase/epimerase
MTTKLSVMLMCCNGGLSAGALQPADLIADLAAVGVTGLEAVPQWCAQEADLWTELRRIAEDAGMQWCCCDVVVNFIGDGSRKAREEALEKVVREVDFCRRLGCELALLPGTKPAPGMSNEEGRRIYGDCLAAVVERTAGSGVTLMIEDFGVYPHFAAGAGHCEEVLAGAGDAVRFNFDNGNFLLGGDLPVEAYQRFRERVAHVHIKDFRVRAPDDSSSLVSPSGVGYEGCEIGSGDAQVAGCLHLLKRDGYEGWLSLEAGGYDNIDSALAGARVIRDIWER